MSGLFYILDEDKKPVTIEHRLPDGTVDEDALRQFIEWWDENLTVKRDSFPPNDIIVSTVFLGISLTWKDPPLLFETMIFGLEYEYQKRYTTYAEALEGHEAAMEVVREELKKRGTCTC